MIVGSLQIEVGPTPQGVLRADVVALTERALHLVLAFLEVGGWMVWRAVYSFFLSFSLSLFLSFSLSLFLSFSLSLFLSFTLSLFLF